MGTLPNQTYPGTATPLLAVTKGDPGNNNELVCVSDVLSLFVPHHYRSRSYLVNVYVSLLHHIDRDQNIDRILAACTCPGGSHPGPVRSDGSYVGRAAPEIDVFEAIVDSGVGKVCRRFLVLIAVLTIFFSLFQVSLSAQFAPFNVNFYPQPSEKMANILFF